MILLEDSPSSTSVAFAVCFYTHVFLLLQRAPLIILLCRHWSTSTPMRWSWPLATHALLRPSWRKPLASGSSRSLWQSVHRSARWGLGWLYHIVLHILTEILCLESRWMLRKFLCSWDIGDSSWSYSSILELKGCVQVSSLGIFAVQTRIECWYLYNCTAGAMSQGTNCILPLFRVMKWLSDCLKRILKLLSWVMQLFLLSCLESTR